MSIAVPFSGVDRRTAWLRAILLSATMLGLIASAPVWYNAHAYPLLPIAAWVPILPARLQRYVQPFGPDYDPQHQGPCCFAFQAWCYEDLHVPPIPEPRSFRSMFRYLRAYSRQPEDLRMIVGTRGGPVMFYQGDSVEFLEQAR